jgi:hypothetical protein
MEQFYFNAATKITKGWMLQNKLLAAITSSFSWIIGETCFQRK